MSGAPAYHGWTHRPKAQGGTDPIPGLSDPGGYPLVQSLMGPETIDNGYTVTGGWDNFDAPTTKLTYDPTIWGTWLNESSADGVAWYRAARLGPKGAVFAFSIIGDLGADCGKVRVSIARDPENDADGLGPTVPDGYLQDPESPTYYDLSTDPFGNNNDFVDFYDASQTDTSYVNEAYEFRILGDPGDALTSVTKTSDGGNDGAEDVNIVNGGPGVYWIRLKVDGKHSNSSGYAVRLRGFYVVRQVASFYGIST